MYVYIYQSMKNEAMNLRKCKLGCGGGALEGIGGVDIIEMHCIHVWNSQRIKIAF